MSGTARVYVDRSGSMIGYLNGADQFTRPLHDLLGNLPVILRQAGGTPEYRSFGRVISAPVAEGPKPFFQPAFYSCTGKDRATCDSAESHLDQVLNTVADDGKAFAVILTDLWYDNSAEQMSGLTALQEPLTRILKDGRMVAVYGIAAPFKGDIYDIPVNGAESRTLKGYAGKHPLYMLAVGSKAEVLAFDEQLAASGSKAIADGLRAGTIRKSLFTVDPGPLVQRRKRPLEKGNHPRLSGTAFTTFPGLNVQQFTLKPGLDISAPKKAILPTWVGPKEDDFLPFSVWQGELAGKIRIFKRNGEQCALATTWSELNAIDVGEPDAGQFRLALDPEALQSRMGNDGVYVVTGAIERTSVTVPNPANDWLRGWSVDPQQGASLMQKSPALFPTLNVSEVARIMENALADAAKQKGGGIVGFTVLVQVKD